MNKIIPLMVACLFVARLWAQPVEEPRNPSLGDGRVLVVRQGLLAVEMTTGQMLWRTLVEKQLFEPTLAGNRLYVGSTDGLFALEAATGKPLWRVGEGLTLYSPIRVGERLYAGSVDGTLWALAADDGRVLWKRRLPGWVYTPAWLGGRLVTGGSEQRLWALDPADGRTLWEAALDQELVFRPVAAFDGLVVTTYAGTTSHYTARGALRWRMDDGVAAIRPLVAGDRVLLAGLDGRIRLRRLADGRLLARAELGGRITRSPAVMGSRALVLTEAGHMGLFSLSRGGWLRKGRTSLLDPLPLAIGEGFFLIDRHGGVTDWPQETSFP